MTDAPGRTPGSVPPQAGEQAESLVRLAIAHAPMTLSIVASDGAILLSEGGGLELLGQLPGQTVGRNVHELYASRPDITDLYGRVLAGETVRSSAEVNGRILEGTMLPMRGPDGEIVGTVSIGLDATERVLAQRALAISEARARSLMDHAPDAIFVADARGRLVDINPAGCALLQGEREQLLGQSLADTIPAEDLEREPSVYGRLRVGQSLRINRRLRRADGSLVQVEQHVTLLPDGNMQAVARDMTERIAMEEALLQAQRIATLASWDWDAATGRVDISSAGLKLIGYGPGDDRPTDDALADQILPGDRDALVDALTVGGREGKGVATRFRAVHLDGGVRHFEIQAEPRRDPDGAVAGLAGTIQDVTERAETAERLQRSERNLAEAQRIIRVGSWEWDLVAGTAWRSDELHRVLGVEPGTIPGTTQAFLEYVHPDDRARVEAADRGAIDDGRPYQLDYRIVWPDGTTRIVHQEGAVTVGEDGTAVRMVGTVEDVTDRLAAERERARLEEEVRRNEGNLAEAQRIAQVGSWEWDLITDTAWRSDELHRIFGVEPGAIPGTTESYLEFVHPDDRVRVRESEQAAIAEGRPYDLTFRLVRPDGTVRTLHERGEVIRDPSGAPIRMVGTAQDITDRLNAEAERARLAAAVEAASDSVVIADLDGIVKYVNPAFERMSGYPSDAVVGRADNAWLETVEFDPGGAASFVAALREGRSWSGEWTSRDRDGVAHRQEVTLDPVLDTTGRVVEFLEIMRDVTAQQRLDDELRRSERNLAEAQRIARLGGWEWEAASRRATLSDAAYALLGYAPGDERPMGNALLDLVPEEDRKSLLAFLVAALRARGSLAVQVQAQHRDGSVRHFEIQAEPNLDASGTRAGLLGTIQDVTERAHAAERLRRSETELARAQAIAHVGSWELDLLTGSLHWSDETYRIFGYEPGSIEPSFDAYARLLEPEDRERMTARNRRALEGGTEDLATERLQRINRPDGTVRFNATDTKVEFDATGRPVRITGINQDVTERAAADLERSRLAAAVEQAGELVMITEPSGAISYVNGAFEEITGYSRADVLGRMPSVMKWGGIGNPAVLEMWRTIAAGQRWSGQVAVSRKDGTAFDLMLQSRPVRDTDGRIISLVAVGRDVTRERMLEDQLREAQKLEAIGRLAGGIAHDFNNLLTAIQGYGEMLVAALPAPDPRREDASEILRAADRAASLTRQLLAFGRRAVLRPRPIDLNATVRGVSRMLERVIGEDVELRFTPQPDLWLVDADPGQLEQVIVNLAINARDAMAGGGRFTIETGNTVVDEITGRQQGMEPGEYVRLVARDSGAGIAAEHLPHLFEPFFTTKDPGKGTGLGLATVFGIMTMSGGHIVASSPPGEGATFTILLPRIPDGEAVAPAEPPEAETDPSGPVNGSERVLVAEDEASVRAMITSTLASAGFQVTEAVDGATALEAARDGRFDLLVTDVIMPDISGVELVRRVWEIHPRVPVLYSSGYGIGVLTDRGVLAEGVELLEKPYGPRELLERVRAILDARLPSAS